jgi:GGDEF domain-containing protein
VTFAQGYYLGRPGSLDQTLAGGLVEWLRGRWSQAHSHRIALTVGQRIGRLVRPAIIVDAALPMAKVACELEDNADPGVVVTEDSRCVGWADRQWITERSGGEQAGYPIGSIMAPSSPPVSPDDCLTDVLEQMSARTGKFATHPLIVADAGHIVGIVHVSDVLSAAAEVARNRLSRHVSLTGLPGRVRADEHVSRLITSARATSPAHRHDAVIIDIRHFADYNGTYGYELGDQLLLELGAAIRSIIIEDNPDVFAAHLADDRFFLTGRIGSLADKLERLAARFEGVAARLPTGPLSAASQDAPIDQDAVRPGVGLRIVLIPDAMAQCADARDLFRLARRLHDIVEPRGEGVERLGHHSLVYRATQEIHELRVTA